MCRSDANICVDPSDDNAMALPDWAGCPDFPNPWWTLPCQSHHHWSFLMISWGRIWDFSNLSLFEITPKFYQLVKFTWLNIIHWELHLPNGKIMHIWETAQNSWLNPTIFLWDHNLCNQNNILKYIYYNISYSFKVFRVDIWLG